MNLNQNPPRRASNQSHTQRSQAAVTHVTPRTPQASGTPTVPRPIPPVASNGAGAMATQKIPLAPNAPGTVIPSPALPAYEPNEAFNQRSSAARERVRKRRGRGRAGVEWAWVIIAGALLSVVIVFSLTVTMLLRTAQNGVAFMPTSAAGLPTPVDARIDFDGQDINLIGGQQLTLDDGRSIVLQPWNGGSRLSVLFMGLDRRPGETGLGYRTDTMMLVSFDRDSNSLGILSIPRDLYVDIPGYGQDSINTTVVYGELDQPNYGPVLAMQTVQYNLGMYVHNYVAMDFNAVVGLVDAVGGLDIDVPYDIVDYEYPDMNFGYDPLILQAGMQHLDGATSLKFARTRHGDNDFERGRRQQMVVFALRDRILNLNMLPQLIIQTPSLISTFENNVYMNLTTDQIIQMALTLKDIPGENIRTGVIDANYTSPFTTENGRQVLIPRRSQLATLLTQVFGADYSE